MRQAETCRLRRFAMGARPLVVLADRDGVAIGVVGGGFLASRGSAPGAVAACFVEGGGCGRFCPRVRNPVGGMEPVPAGGTAFSRVPSARRGCDLARDRAWIWAGARAE